MKFYLEGICGTMDGTDVIVGVLSALVGGFVVWIIAERRIAMQHVTAERTKWRSEIRRLTTKIHDAILRGGHRELQLLGGQLEVRLNPDDNNDQAILKSIQSRQEREFLAGITKLLKHDWERAKLEAKVFPFGWLWEARRGSDPKPYPVLSGKRVVFLVVPILVVVLIVFLAWCYGVDLARLCSCPVLASQIG